MVARPPALAPALAALAGSSVSTLQPLPKRGSDGLEPRVRIHHPYYDEPHDILLVLRGVDPLPSHRDGPIQPYSIDAGLHHATVLHACAIIAGNAFDKASLSRDRDGHEPVLPTLSLHDILEPSDYWLQISNSSTPSLPYPISASFSDWRFPHRPLPEEWLAPHKPPAYQLPSSVSQPGDIVHMIENQRSGAEPCRMSGHRGATEPAHLVPQAMTDWFVSNMMGQYTRQSAGNINDDANRLRLRVDLHYLFDAHRFIFVPKPVRPAPSTTDSTSSTSPATTTTPARPDYALAVHVLEPTKDLEVVALYHNLSLQTDIEDYQDARRFLFARFAYAIFSLLQPFLKAARRYVLVAKDSTDEAGIPNRSKLRRSG